MSSPFTGPQSGNGALNKLPFLIVPVSQSAQDVDPRRPSATSVHRSVFEKCSNDTTRSNAPSTQSPSPLKPGLPISLNSEQTCERKPAQSSRSINRSAELQKQLNAHFSPAATYPTLLQTFSAHHQLRRPARLLYPDTEQLDPTSSSTTGPEDQDSGAILYNGVKITRDSCQEILRPPPNFPQSHRFPAQNRRRVLLSANVSSEELPRAIPPIAEKSNRKNRYGIPNPGTEKRHVCRDLLQSNESSKPENPKVLPSLQFQVDELVKQLRAKDVEMTKLKNELLDVKKSVENFKTVNASISCQDLKKGLSRVEKQLEHLEDKVDGCDGDTYRRNSGLNNLTRRSSMEFGVDRLDFPVRISPDYDRIIRTAKELNFMVANNAIELCYNSSGATFKPSESVTLTLYKNGLILDVQPLIFKSFSNPSTFDFIQDIYDGYFPSELQDKYPNGITLIVNDKRSVTYTKSAGVNYFTGKGVKMSETCLRPVLPRYLPGMVYNPPRPTSIEKTVSADSFKSEFSIKSDSHFEELPDLMPNHLIPFHHKKMGSKNIILLKLKNIITGDLYKLRTSVHATIRNLLDHLEDNLNEDDSTKSQPDDDDDVGIIRRRFELINILPFGSFAILGASLRDYGITTNSLLYFRPK